MKITIKQLLEITKCRNLEDVIRSWDAMEQWADELKYNQTWLRGFVPDKNVLVMAATETDILTGYFYYTGGGMGGEGEWYCIGSPTPETRVVKWMRLPDLTNGYMNPSDMGNPISPLYKLIEAHKLLAKLKLDIDDYRPISILLAEAKLEIFKNLDMGFPVSAK